MELFDHLAACKQNDWCLIELLVIYGNTWNHLALLTCSIELSEIELLLHSTVCKQETVFFKYIYFIWLTINKILPNYAKLICLKLSENI